MTIPHSDQKQKLCGISQSGKYWNLAQVENDCGDMISFLCIVIVLSTLALRTAGEEDRIADINL